ncbi:hypothetical protein NDU88_007044 [Pleurodeles waltl]|uniref:Uncharacterized protein n=1 Tax=Pleurodeles waltl TaxID=8319 RepID=A0AAV7NS36_PLEWA|nr:hypothetical protein NDU88_007044 [Pleurodeles waltl]
MGADIKYPWDTSLNARACLHLARPYGSDVLGGAMPDPEGVKPAKGERGGRRAYWRNGTRHSMVQPGQRGWKVSRRRKRRKEDAAQSRECSLRGGQEGQLRMRKPATFLEELGLSRYKNGQGKEV